jgi:nitroreductase
MGAQGGLDIPQWRLNDSDLPWRPNWREVMRLLVGYALRAPSSRNTEPWWFRATGSRLDLMIDWDRWMKVADPDRRELYLSAGCALENLLIAAEHLGLGYSLTWFPEPNREDWVATVELREASSPASPRPPELFEVIPERCTNHKPFAGDAIPAETQERLAACVREPELRLHLIEEAGTREWIAELVARAEEREFADPAFRRELAAWLGRGVLFRSGPLSKVAAVAVRHADLGHRIAQRDAKAALTSPALAVITSDRNDRLATVRAGMLGERIWLQATAHGLAVQPMSAPLEVPPIKHELAGLLGVPDRFPMLMFRIGYAEPERLQRPRRSVDDVLQFAGD